MKKRRFSRLRRLFSSIFRIRYWFDWERVRAFTGYLWKGATRFFVLQQAAKPDSFEEVVKQLQLTETDLELKQKALWRLSILMFACSGLIFMYMLYHLAFGSLLAVAINIAVLLIALVLAFRYNFWYFQIKKRKLGCTISEWFRQGILGERE